VYACTWTVREEWSLYCVSPSSLSQELEGNTERHGCPECGEGLVVAMQPPGDEMDSLAGVFHEIETSSTSLRDSSPNLMVNNHVIL